MQRRVNRDDIGANYTDTSNLAYDYGYDFSHFDERQIQHRKEKAQAQKQERSPMKFAVTKETVGTGVIAVACIIAVFAAVTSINIVSTECYDTANRVVKQQEALRAAEETNALLQSKLDSKVNINYIEEYATVNLGMQKVTAAQKSYISVDTEKLVEATEDKSGGFFGSVRRWFSDLLEYIGF